jgi:nicotinamidase/pyrazinamidase
MKTLLIVDVQYDFLPGGSLGVPKGNEVIPAINAIIADYDLVLATRDFHPADHKSFASQHKDQNPGDVVILNGIEQVLWPDHCIQDTHGSEISREFKLDMINKIIYKGTNRDIDSYSAFFDNNHKTATELNSFLQQKGVKELDITGLALNYCVKYTALDAIKLGYKANIQTSACRGIELMSGDIDRALGELRNAGVVLI